MKKWEIVSKLITKSEKEIVETLLKNRGLKTEKEKQEFFDPISPLKITLKSLGIKETEVKKAIDRIKKAKKTQERVFVYGDYDADGITGTATLWETLNAVGLNVMPHIPDRFLEGYGLNIDTITKLKEKDKTLGLIITVDHGIVAGKKVDEIKKLGIDLIITDHHQADKILPKTLALIYTDKIGGSGVAWMFSREIVKYFKIDNFKIEERLQLAAIGTIADQLPLVGPNRSIVKCGLAELDKTKRPGLLALFDESKLTGVPPVRSIGTYEVGFIIAPRINAMGRLKHGLESLRLLCTTSRQKALEISKNIGETNTSRQKIVEEVIVHTRGVYKDLDKQSIIVLSDESYHEGVIGLAAAKLVEEFYLPAIVMSVKGDIAKASARSISGFNIIEAIRELRDLYIEGGGHPMAAGFSISVANIAEFTKQINSIAKKGLTAEMLQRKLKADLELDFSQLNFKLYEKLKEFDPVGTANPGPTFVTKKVEVVSVKKVGKTASHLKLKLKQHDFEFNAIAFGLGLTHFVNQSDVIDIMYQIDEDSWNGGGIIQLRIKDIRV